MEVKQINTSNLGLKEFGIFVAKSMTAFMIISIVVVWLHVFGTGSTFAVSWRWYHDTLLIPIFWYIAPIFLLAFIFDLASEKLKTYKLLQRLPTVVHELVVVFFLLGCATVVSQLLGGCIWFYPTEGWWRRFVPPSMINENFAILFYFVFSIISSGVSWAYWKKFVYRSKAIN
jgi:hypothetical protein